MIISKHFNPKIIDADEFCPKGKLVFAFRRLSEKQKGAFLCVLSVLSDPEPWRRGTGGEFISRYQ